MKPGDKVYCKKTTYFRVNIKKDNFFSRLFIKIFRLNILYKKGKYYKIQSDFDNMYIVESEMNKEQCLSKKGFKKIFYTVSELRKKKLKKFRKNNFIYRQKIKFFPNDKEEKR